MISTLVLIPLRKTVNLSIGTQPMFSNGKKIKASALSACDERVGMHHIEHNAHAFSVLCSILRRSRID